MLALFRTWLVALAMTIGLAAPALAQGLASFDGTYAGVSRTLLSDTTRHRDCAPSGNVSDLTIRGGVAQVKWGAGTYDGQANPQGALSMRATSGAHFDGQITGDKVHGRSQSAKGKCIYEIIWQKR
jgi:hypothetical protein